MSSFGKDRDTALSGHPTVKPLALVSDAILDCSKRGGIVLDAFAGSGTTLLAAEKTGRRGHGIELDLHYSDLIIERFSQVYGLKATHVDTGISFDNLRNEQTELRKDGKAKKNAKAAGAKARKKRSKARG